MHAHWFPTLVGSVTERVFCAVATWLHARSRLDVSAWLWSFQPQNGPYAEHVMALVHGPAAWRPAVSV